jgi:flagellum-specific peptidoglycan hydrolase FlgJ
VQKFFKTYKNIAIEASKGVLPSIVLAQAFLESAGGSSKLAKLANNYFGIKADSSWRGEKILMNTREVFYNADVFIDDYFRQYDSVYDSFRDHSQFLNQNPRYESVLKAETPEQQAIELQKAGYATAPNYAETLMQIINDNQLYEVDKQKTMSKRLDIVIVIALTIVLLVNWYKILKY